MATITNEDLTQFTGTTTYYRISKRFLLTDGTKYLSEHAACFWLMDAVSSQLLEIGVDDWFVLVRLKCQQAQATLHFEDGNHLIYMARGIERNSVAQTELMKTHCSSVFITF